MSIAIARFAPARALMSAAACIIALAAAHPLLADAPADPSAPPTSASATTPTKPTTPTTPPAAEPAQGKSPSPSAKDWPRIVGDLVTQLASTDYYQREAGSKALLDLPPQCLPIVVDHYRRSNDAEVKMRIERYAQQYFQRHVLDAQLASKRPAFLGVSMRPTVLPDGRPAVRIEDVIADTAADEAGIRVGDYLVEFEGEALVAGQTSDSLGRSIRAHNVGDEVTFTIQRNDQALQLKARLKPFPLEHLSDAQRQQEQQLARELREQWWAANFPDHPVHGQSSSRPTAEPETD